MAHEPLKEVDLAGFIMNVTTNVDDWLLTMQLQDG